MTTSASAAPGTTAATTTRPYHVFVCTAGGEGFFDKARKMHQAQAATRHSHHAHQTHCGQMGGDDLYRKFQVELAASGLENVLLAPMSCVQQHLDGPMILVYPDGIWYSKVEPDDIPVIVEEHLRHGRIVDSIVHYRLEEKPLETACGSTKPCA